MFGDVKGEAVEHLWKRVHFLMMQGVFCFLNFVGLEYSCDVMA